MNKQETTQIITLLAGNYNTVADKTKEQKIMMINTWYECLKDLDYQLVLSAVKKTIIESPYPPTIHDIRKNAIELVNPTTQRTAIEAWNEAHRMICNGLYMTEEEFEQHSPEVKRFFGNVRQVKEQAQIDTDVVNSVTKGQFLKQYEVIVERKKQDKLLPETLKQINAKLVENASIKMIGE